VALRELSAEGALSMRLGICPRMPDPGSGSSGKPTVRRGRPEGVMAPGRPGFSECKTLSRYQNKETVTLHTQPVRA
jgi:hypothetical protein